MAPMCRKEWTYQNGEATALVRSDCLKQNATNFNVDNTGSITSPQNFEAKNLGQIQFEHSSKNTSSTTPLPESEAMRKWKAIKQNGFLTHPHGGVPMPEPQFGKKSRKRKSANKRKFEIAKVEKDIMKKEITTKENDNGKTGTVKSMFPNRVVDTVSPEQHCQETEQDNMLKTAPASGLLDRISTGLIKRVKNCKEVHAILEDVVQLEKLDGELIKKSIGQEESGGKEFTDLINYQNQLLQSFNRTSVVPSSEQKSNGIISENLAATSCSSDYYKKLSWVLTAYSDMINRKCDNILSVENDIDRQVVPLNSGHGQ